MNITAIPSLFQPLSHDHIGPSRPVSPDEFLRVPLGDDLLKARALQRWENEGGRSPRHMEPADAARKTKGAR